MPNPPPKWTGAPTYLCSTCGGRGLEPDGEACRRCDGSGALCEYFLEPVDSEDGMYVAPNGKPACLACAEAEDWD